MLLVNCLQKEIQMTGDRDIVLNNTIKKVAEIREITNKSHIRNYATRNIRSTIR